MTEQKTFIAWDKELASKAAKQHKYIYVSENNTQRKFKLLSGAENAWNPGSNKPVVPYIYISELSIMGLKEDVVKVLSDKFTESEINGFLKSAYTSTNHGKDYTEELEKLKVYKSTTLKDKKNKIRYGLEDLAWFFDALKDVKEEPIDKLSDKNSKISPKSKRDIFRALYNKAVEQNKFVNVSKLDTTGARARDQPTAKGNTVCSELTRIESNNVKNYKKAIEWAFGSTTEYEADIEQMRASLGDKKVGKKPVKAVTPPQTPKEEVKNKKKQLGSPRKSGVPGSKSPGAVVTRGGDNFTPIPTLKK